MNNPLSPHLQIYRWQITSVLSILHRITGVILSLGTIILATWLLCLSIGEFYFDFFNHLISNFIGRTIMIGYTWSVCFHTLNGIRHLGWDYGYGLDLSIVKLTGWSVVIGSLIMTIIIWVLSVI
jgi:succinate dehydrogenase / fumarate reductase cytochrome b subunit